MAPIATPEIRKRDTAATLTGCLRIARQPHGVAHVNNPMRLKTIQIVVALTAALAFVLAFIAASIFILSTVFMLVGMAAIAWLAWSVIKQVPALARMREPRAPTANRR